MYRLREVRMAAGLTQDQLAASSGIAQATISQIEGGASTTTRTLHALAEALGVGVAELFAASPEQEEEICG